MDRQAYARRLPREGECCSNQIKGQITGSLTAQLFTDQALLAPLSGNLTTSLLTVNKPQPWSPHPGRRVVGGARCGHRITWSWSRGSKRPRRSSRLRVPAMA
eukprot:5775828-Prymnesium_polylepis.1